MNTLRDAFLVHLDLISTDYVRDFHASINWKNRLIGILGQKGVGKSTMILQHIKMFDNIDETLYVSADNFYFAGNRIYDLAFAFFKEGGKRLYIDEIHKYKGWSTEIKMIYDQLPTLQVVYSGSSLLDLRKGGKADLSRRTREYTMPVLSFREYLNITMGWKLQVASLDEVLAGKVDFPYGEHRPLKHFKDYLRCGCYPYCKEEDFLIKLQQAVMATVEEDIPKYAEMTTASAHKLKQLMYVLTQSVPFKPNYAHLSRQLEISRNVLPDYVSYLEKSGIFNLLTVKARGDSMLEKPEKLYLSNSNIAYAISSVPIDAGTEREMMFFEFTKQKYPVYASEISDFEIGDKTFEVGGKGKKGRQIAMAKDGYIVKDDTEHVVGRNVPLWMFGFLY